MLKRFMCLPLILLIFLASSSTVLAVNSAINEIPTVSLEALQQVLTVEGEAAYTEKEVKAYLKEIIPLIEKHAGKKFLKAPIVKLTDRKGMVQILSKEIGLQIKNALPQINDEELQTMAFSQASALSISLLGKFGIFGQTVYLMPKNIKPLFSLLNVDQSYLKSLIKITIAHELTHALQNQEINLKKMYSFTNIEAAYAYNATIEGHAVFIAELVAKDLGLEKAAVQFSRIMSAGAIIIDDPVMENINKTVSTLYEQVYLGGKTFIEYHYQQGGNPRLWKILNVPPINTTMIANPATYSFDQTTKKSDYAGLFKELNDKLTAEKWMTQNIEIGTMLLKATFAKLEKPVQDEILNNVEHVQSLVAQKNNNTKLVSVSLIVYKNEKFGLRYLSIMEKLAKSNVEEIKASQMYDVKNFFSSKFPGIQSDAARRISFDIISKSDNVSTTQSLIRIARGRVVLEFTFNDKLLTYDEVREIAEQLFLKYEMLQNTNF